jgi:hypothetical protein
MRTCRRHGLLQGALAQGSLGSSNGSVATFEDWFDPRRLQDITTGYKSYGVKTRVVEGHEIGLKLPPDDKRALIAFLRTL